MEAAHSTFDIAEDDGLLHHKHVDAVAFLLQMLRRTFCKQMQGKALIGYQESPDQIVPLQT